MRNARLGGRRRRARSFAELVADSARSQRAIAAEVGVAESTVSRWIAGDRRPGAPTRQVLARVLGVELEDVDRAFAEVPSR